MRTRAFMYKNILRTSAVQFVHDIVHLCRPCVLNRRCILRAVGEQKQLEQSNTAV